MKTSLIMLLLLFSTAVTYSQEKFEREYRIKQSEVPVKALEFIERSFENAKMKWYGEESLKGKAIEAKGKKDGKLYSVKFDTLGVLQDVEIRVKFKSLSENTRSAIKRTLEDHFSKFKIQKTQIQWIGDKADLMSLIKGENVQNEYLTHYEIIIKGTKDNRTDYYEVLVNEMGELVRKSKIIQRNNQHLLY